MTKKLKRRKISLMSVLVPDTELDIGTGMVGVALTPRMTSWPAITRFTLVPIIVILRPSPGCHYHIILLVGRRSRALWLGA